MIARNYAMADKFKPKIYVPFIGIEIYGRLTLVVILVVNLMVVSVVGSILSLIIGTSAYYLSLALSLGGTVAILTLIKQCNKNAGSNKLLEFFYNNVKKYDCIYDAKGQKKYICPKIEGVIYINVCRKTI